MTDAQVILLARLAAAPWAKLSQLQRSRLIWRIGQLRLKAAVPRLVQLLEQGDAMQDYCLAFAIGRCGDAGAQEAMLVLRQRGRSEAVRRMALHAWLQLATASMRQRHADNLVADWPAALRKLWPQQDLNALLQTIQIMRDSQAWHGISFDGWLEQLDQVALVQPFARQLLLALLQQIKPQAGVFRALRHLYKAAEFRADGVLFGLLHQCFENNPSDFPKSTYGLMIGRNYVHFHKEVLRADSRVAYGAATREYLLRRSWRHLRRLAADASEAGQAEFIAMASGALLAMDDASAGVPARRTTAAGQERHYGPYSRWLLLNRLLLANNGNWHSNRMGSNWYALRAEDVLPVAELARLGNAGRDEAFGHIWDQAPQTLLDLLRQSRCAAVQAFAARALQDNAAFCATLSEETLGQLLASTYLCTARLAFLECKRRMLADTSDTSETAEQGAPWLPLLKLLLQSSLPEAQTWALDCIALQPLRYCADNALMLLIIRSRQPQVRRQARLLCQLAQTLPRQADALCQHILLWLQELENTADHGLWLAEISEDLLWLLDNPLQAAAGAVPFTHLLLLLQPAPTALAQVQILAGEWILRLPQLEQHLASLPAATLLALLQAEDEGVRVLGVKLFAALPNALLLQQSDLVLCFATHAMPAIRQAITPLLTRLLAQHAGFGATLLPGLLDCLFRSETGEGVHAGVLQLLQTSMQSNVLALDAACVMRLLQAKSRGAQTLGAWLLPRFAASQFTLRDWVSLSKNEDQSVRQWVYAAYRQHPDQVRAQLPDALRLLDSKWEDCRSFAFDFFASQCHTEDWQAAILIQLCDHSDSEVLQFAASLLRQHYRLEDVADYVLKLSQHPSAKMQLLVSEWLEQHMQMARADGNDDNNNDNPLQALHAYFLNVLSQVNRGRVVKDRVLAFLQQQALQSAASAEFVGQIFARQVVTVAIGDKAQYIAALQQLQQHYPQLDFGLRVIAPRAVPPVQAVAGNETGKGVSA